MRPDLSADEARRAALVAQGLLGAADRPRRPAAVLARVGALQLDTISVLARSHELVCLARCGPLPRGAVDRACWVRDPAATPTTFEYRAHAASILPIELWPWFAFRRRRWVERHAGANKTDDTADAAKARAEVLARLGDGVPLTATELGGAKASADWWDWSPVKRAVEHLLADGVVVCTSRRSWKREYRLAADAVPDHLLAEDPDDAACIRHLVGLAGRHVGVGTVADLADYWRLRLEDVRRALPDTDLVEVTVPGWGPAWADPAALDGLGVRGRHRTTMLSPFDSLIWDRDRTERIWGLRHRLEAYTPAAKRVHGYYAMPVLVGGRIVARVDPARTGRTLVARRVGFLQPRPGAATVASVAAALREAAAWVGADVVEVEVVDPPAAAGPLRTALDEPTD